MSIKWVQIKPRMSVLSVEQLRTSLLPSIIFSIITDSIS